MQQPAQAPPPPQPEVPTPTVVIPGAAGPLAVPTTREELAAIRAMRSELSSQLSSAANRRERLAEELEGLPPEARAGVQDRIRTLDDRIVQLENDIANTGRLLTSAPAGLIASTSQARTVFAGFSEGPATAISIVFTIFVLFPLALAAARLMWKRSRTPARIPLTPEATQRLERIEQSVDAIAIEVERVTEGQRFLTRLLTEAKPQTALPAAQRPQEPERVHANTILTRGEGGS
jgi:FtsZ-binding cell division protein ZapB